MNDIKAIKKIQRSNRINPNISVADTKSSFKLTIKKIATDVDGTIIDKNTLPDSMKVSYPVFLFGQFDQQGGYAIGQKLLPIEQGNKLIAVLTVDGFFDLLQFSGANNIKNELMTGDVVLLYADNEFFPTNFIWVIITGENRAYASILKNPLNTGMQVFSFKYFADNNRQFIEDINLVDFNEVGDYKRYNITPQSYKDPDYQQEGLIQLDIDYKIENFSGLYQYMKFETDAMTFVYRYFKPKMVERIIK